MATAMDAPTQAGAADGLVVLPHVSWETYERLLADHLDASVPHFTYDRGVLEIVSPSTPHEEDNRTLALLVEVVAEELGIDVRNVGSTTFKREDLQRGFEPDSSFYIQHEDRVSGRVQIDLAVDPPPDLVIEIDVTNPLLDKRSVYAAMGIPEVWVLGRQGVAILRHDGDRFEDADRSLVLPPLDRAILDQFVAASRTLKRTAWLKQVRAWVGTGRRALNAAA